MSALEAINERIEQLLDEARTIELDTPTSRQLRPERTAQCIGWLAAADNLVRLACPSPDMTYRAHAQALIAANAHLHPTWRHEVVANFAGILRRLKEDIAAGLLVSLENRVSGETFDDLLDHAQAYFDENRKEPAGVVAGVVFEDTIRRVCRKHKINEAGVKLDTLINALKSQNALSKLEGKAAVTAAGLRTAATHAQWSEFKLEDVRQAIDLARRLIRDHLDTA